MESMTLDAGLFVWTLITFGCLLLVLTRYAFRPLRRILAEREETIRRAVEAAEHARQEAEKLVGRNEEQLAEARQEARKIINEGHKIVTTMRREAGEQAKRDAQAMVDEARTEIDREVQRSLEELKGTVANLSVRIARQFIKERLDESDHQRLADEFVERLKKGHGGGRA